MNARTLALGLALAGTAAAAPSAPSQAPVEFTAAGFSAVGADYKKAEVLPETFFNPFHVQNSVDSMQKRGGAAVTDEAVTEAIGTRGISGVLFNAKAGASRVILGDQVFTIGEEIGFPDPVTGADSPLVKGASVVLRRVSRESLGLDVSPETEPTRRVNIPLRAFWRP